MYHVVIKNVEPLLVISVCAVVPNKARIGAILGCLYGELMGHMALHYGQCTGPALSRYLDDSEKDTDILVEACIPIASPIPESDSIRVYEIEGCNTMACVLHFGLYETMGSVHRVIVDWVDQNGYKIAGPAREVYLSHEFNMPSSKYITEVQYPILKIQADSTA